MNLSSTFWRFTIVLLSFPIERCRLLPASCQRFNGLGYLTVKPARLFLIGSNLTVSCHVKRCQRSSKMSLELNGNTVHSGKKVNCTTTIFSLVDVRTPRSTVRCKLQSDQLSKVVSGLDLRGGFPPDKPANILCETSKSSDVIDCWWERGRDTHLLTTYNISLNRENGTQILLDQIQDADKATIRRGMIEANTAYRLIVAASNHFGASRSDPFVLRVKDIMTPETPRIMQLDFGNHSVSAVLRRETSETSENLTTDVRLRADNGSWEAGEGTEVREGEIRVDGLRPLTDYEFQMRTCNPPSGPTRINATRLTSSKGSLCSKWSPSVRGRSPGKGPSQQIHAWRMFGILGANGQRMLKVLWKPPFPEDHSGDVQHYKIFLGQEQQQEVVCPAALSQCSLQVPAEVQALRISAVTLYGTSPPADVPLRHSGDSGPVLRALAPAANHSAAFVSWYKHRPTSGGELLRYVLEWTSVPGAALHWREVSKDQTSTFIKGLTAGVRYNISLYAVTSRGVSAPSSGLVYSKEQKPATGPNVSVLVHRSRRIRIQWDELPVDKQKGFILNYTVYLQTLDNSNPELRVTLPASGPRPTWLECPEGALALQLSASTSAGEGWRGNRICSQPEGPSVGLVIVSVFIVTFFIAIVANLMCWGCVRERIKQQCVSCRPAWLDVNLPKPGNSNAIRLLEQCGGEPSFSSSYSDPPLSPISLISQEESDGVYPTVHAQSSQGASVEPAAGTPLLPSDPETMLVDGLLEHVSYKPQIVTSPPRVEEVMGAEEEEQEGPSSGEEVRFGGLLGGFLSDMEVDFTTPPPGLTLSSVGGLLWPKSPETKRFLNGSFLLGETWTGNDVEADSPPLDSQRGETVTLDSEDTCLFQYEVEMTLIGGYFPQAASSLCDAQR